MANAKDLVFKFTKMDVFMRVNGKMIREMAKVMKSTKMETNITELT
jgi:hypothetical protein